MRREIAPSFLLGGHHVPVVFIRRSGSRSPAHLSRAAPDLRAGLAYVIAAAFAPGETLVSGIPFLERGYGNIVPRLAAMNLQIENYHKQAYTGYRPVL